MSLLQLPDDILDLLLAATDRDTRAALRQTCKLIYARSAASSHTTLIRAPVGGAVVAAHLAARRRPRQCVVIHETQPPLCELTTRVRDRTVYFYKCPRWKAWYGALLAHTDARRVVIRNSDNNNDDDDDADCIHHLLEWLFAHPNNVEEIRGLCDRDVHIVPTWELSERQLPALRVLVLNRGHWLGATWTCFPNLAVIDLQDYWRYTTEPLPSTLRAYRLEPTRPSESIQPWLTEEEEAIDGLTMLPTTLEALDLLDCREAAQVARLPWHRFPSIRVLCIDTLSWCPVPPAQLEVALIYTLETQTVWPRLRCLGIARTAAHTPPYTHGVYRAFPWRRIFPALRILQLDAMGCQFDDALYAALADALPELAEIRLSAADLAPAAAQALRYIPQHPRVSLRVLDVWEDDDRLTLDFINGR